MQPRLTFITLGVADLATSKRFYSEVLGWTPFQDSGIVMYLLNGMVLSLYPQHELMADAKTTDDGRGSRFTLAQCLGTPEAVDALFARLEQHGVTITKNLRQCSGAVTAAISPIRTGTCGRSPTTPSCSWMPMATWWAWGRAKAAVPCANGRYRRGGVQFPRRVFRRLFPAC